MHNLIKTKSYNSDLLIILIYDIFDINYACVLQLNHEHCHSK